MGQTHTKGKKTYSDGSVYEGDFMGNERFGQGKMIWSNGSCYEGRWKYNARSGQGKMTYNNGPIFEGVWSSGELIDGKVTWPDGSFYDGKKALFDDYHCGKITYPDGSVYEGQFTGNEIRMQRMKHGKMTWADGSYFDGEWYDDKPVDSGTYLVRIKQANFELNMQHLTNLINNPAKQSERKKIDDCEPIYELIFEGKVTKNFIPISGKLYVEGLFEFQGQWSNGKVNGKGLLYNIQEKTYEEVHHCYGVRLEPKNKMPLETAVVPQLMGDQVEVEGAV